MRIGFLGAGNISACVAPVVRSVPAITCRAVAARSLDRARAFAEKWGFEKAYGSYEELAEDPEVDVIYVGTPMNLHYEHILLCLRHGKGVICEKAFCMNGAESAEVIAYARERRLFLAEAMWPRYKPGAKQIPALLKKGVIGIPYALTANLFYDIDGVERLVRPELGGGALLDLGVYTLSFALLCFGGDVARIETSVLRHPTGVDGMESVTLFYGDGKMASLTQGIYSRSDRKGIIHGDKGYMVVENINCPEAIRVYDCFDRLVTELPLPNRVNGYEYEFEEMADCFDRGLTETVSLPLSETQRLMELCDAVRSRWS